MKLVISVLKDIFSSIGVPTETVSNFFENRKKMLTEAMLSEIREGDFSNVADDEKIAIVYKLYNSAIEGVAKRNLRLMCRVISGLASKGALKAPVFLKYAQVLSTLSEDELIVLAIMAKYHIPSSGRYNVERDILLNEKFGNKTDAIQSALIRTGLVTLKILAKVKEKPLHNMGYMLSTVPCSEFDAKTNTYYILTPLMDEVMEYMTINIDD